MAVLNAGHLLDQSELLIRPPSAGSPRQVDLRRAVSSAYYAVFHKVMAALADEVVGKTHPSTPRYSQVYRSVSHKALRTLCVEAAKPSAPDRIRRYVPGADFGADLGVFAEAVIELQKKRHTADYDPLARLKTSDAKLAVGLGRRAIARFDLADPDRRRAFLYLLAFPPRASG